MNHGDLVAGDMEIKLSQRHDHTFTHLVQIFFHQQYVLFQHKLQAWLLQQTKTQQDSSAAPRCERDSLGFGCLACNADVRVHRMMAAEWWSVSAFKLRNESCLVRWFVGLNLARSRISVALGRVLDLLCRCLPWLFVYPRPPCLKITI